MIELTTLGRLDLRGPDGDDLKPRLGGAKRLAILTYLAVARPRGPHRRDTLLALFWPELDEERGRRALRQALYRLRQTVGSYLLNGQRDEEVGLDDAGLACDVSDLESSLERDDVEAAVDRYHGDFLVGFHLPGCAEFDRWADRERRRLRDLAAGAAWALAESLAADGRNEEARRRARRAREIAPDDEAGVRRMMVLLDGLGDRSGAVREYHRFAEHLDTDLGLEPSPETQELLAQLVARNHVTTVAEDPAVETLTVEWSESERRDPDRPEGSRETVLPRRVPAVVSVAVVGVAVAAALAVALSLRSARSDGVGLEDQAPVGLAAEPAPGSGGAVDRENAPSELQLEHAIALIGARARRYWETDAEEDGRAMLAQVRLVAELDPDNPRWLAALARAGLEITDRFGQRGAFNDSALALIARAEAFGPKLAVTYDNLSRAYFDLDGYRPALVMARRSLEVAEEPTYSIPGERVLTALGRFDEAVRLKERAATADASYVGHIGAMGNISLVLGDLTTARDWYSYTLALDSTAHAMLLRLAEIDFLEGDVVAARRHLRSAIALPELIASMTGRLELASGRWWEAVQVMEPHVLPDPAEAAANVDFFDAWRSTSDLAYAYQQLGRTVEATAMFAASEAEDRRAIERGVDWFLPWYDLARIHAARGDADEAYRALEEALDRGWRYYYRLGMGPTDPLFASVRDQSRFQELMSRVRHEVDSMRVLANLAPPAEP